MIDSSSEEEASIVRASVITMNNDDGWLQDVTFDDDDDDDDYVVELCYPIIDHGQMIQFNEDNVENTDSDEDTHNKNTKDNDERILSNTYYIYDYHAAKSGKYNNNGKSGKKYGRSGSNTYTTDAADPLVIQNNNDNDDDDDESVEEEIILVMPSSSNTIFAKSSKMSKGAKAGETKSGKACIIVEEGDEDDNDEEEKEDEEEEEEKDEEAEEEEEEVDTEDDDEKDVNDNEEEEDDDETSTPTSMPTSTCTKGCIDCGPESPLPCPPSNLKRICDKDNADGNFFDCYESCKVSFCCIHDSLSKEYSPSCSKEYDNCPLYYPCYIIWWKLHDTIGPATYLRLEQNEPFYDGLDFDRLENDLAKDQQFFQQLFGHHFDTDDAPTDDTFEDENNW